MKQFLMIVACCMGAMAASHPNLHAQQMEAAGDSVTVATITETYMTARNEAHNVDSPAVWHGPNGQHWLLATAKESDVLMMYDARNGKFIQQVGESGTAAGQFDRPNGITVIDNLALVVERNNKRVQVLQLPQMTTLGMLTHEDLRRPYGISVIPKADSSYTVYVTDNYNPALEGYPPQGELDERIQQFEFAVSGNTLSAEHIRAFGAIRGQGVLHKVESIFADPAFNRLLIADEAFNRRNIKLYDLEGHFKDSLIASTYFDSEPEGIALYECGPRSGYWVMTDQHKSDANIFQVFERKSLRYIGGFKGATTRNTDGIWITPQPFAGFSEGAFFAVHDDGNVAAFNWQTIAEQLHLSACN